MTEERNELERPLVELFNHVIRVRCDCGHGGHIHIRKVMQAHPGLETLGGAIGGARCAACGHQGAAEFEILPPEDGADDQGLSPYERE